MTYSVYHPFPVSILHLLAILQRGNRNVPTSHHSEWHSERTYFSGYIFSLNCKCFTTIIAFAQINNHFLIQWTGNFINRFDTATAISLKQSQSRHHKPSTHLALIFVTQIGIGNATTIISINNGTGPFLCQPRFIGPIEQESKMHGLLVALNHRIIPILVIGSIVSPRFTYFKPQFRRSTNDFSPIMSIKAGTS